MRWYVGLLVLLALLLASCAPKATETVLLGEVLSEVDFSHSYDWEQYSNEGQHVDFRIEDGVFRAHAWDHGFIWALNSEAHTNVVIQADTRQLSTYANNAYGLMCRAAPTNNGDGYYFLISGDGSYTIRSGATDVVRGLIKWEPTDAIQQGQAINRIRIVCIDDYLALYVNGRFVAETRDDRYQRGFAGIAAAVPEGGDVDVAFDDLIIREAWLAGEP